MKRKNDLLRLLCFLGVLAFALVTARQEVLAKKKIVFSSGTTSAGRGFIISPRLRKDRRALLVTFSNLNVVNSFTYELTYLGSGVDQGVFGSVTPKGEASTSRELLFGTCSHGVCRYHTNISGMKFKVTATLKNGQTINKRYKVKP